MTKQGTYNLIGMVMLPLAAVVSGFIATLQGTWEAYGATYIALLTINSIVSLFGGFFSWLLLRRSVGERPRWIAITPMLIPSICGSLYYLFRAIVPASVAAGSEYLGMPQYLLIGVFMVLFVVLFLRLTRLSPRIA